MATDYRRYSNTDEQEELELNERCCFGYISAFTCLPILAGLNFFMDITASCLSVGTDLLYFFGVMAVFSLLCFGAVMSGVQEEQRSKVKLSLGWVVAKMFLTALLFACAVFAFLDIDFMTELTRLSLNVNVCTALVAFLPLSMMLLIVQLVWSKQMLRIIAIRDQLYIIPSAIGTVPMRNSLRVHLDQMKAKRYSIATVLPAEKY